MDRRGRFLRVVSFALTCAVLLLCPSVASASSQSGTDSPPSILTIAGNGTKGYSGDGGPATDAELSIPEGVAVDAEGDVLIDDTGNNRLRMVAASTCTSDCPYDLSSTTKGDIYTIAEASGEEIAVDAEGDVIVLETGGNSVWMVAASTCTSDCPYGLSSMTEGDIYTIAGNGTQGYSGDGGPATDAELDFPSGVAVDAEGDVLIGDESNAQVRMVAASTCTSDCPYGLSSTTAGYIYTIAGNGVWGYSGDGGPATDAELNQPQSVAVDADGDVLIADTGNNRLRMVAASTCTSDCPYGLSSTTKGDIYTIAEEAGEGIAVNAEGDVLIGGVDNLSMLAASTCASDCPYGLSSTTAGYIYTIAGDGTQGYSGDGGPATDAELFDPDSLAVDADGDILIADSGNNRIRLIGDVSVAVALSSPQVVADGTSTVTVTASVDIGDAPAAGQTISFSSSDPGEQISAVTDNGNGTYTATITSSTTVGTATVTATDESSATSISGTAQLTQTIGTVSNVAVSLSKSSIVANGISSLTATATVTTSYGRGVSGQDVVFSSSDPGEQISAVTDNGNGTYTATITSSTTVGTATVTATDESSATSISGTAQLTQTLGPPSTVALQESATSIQADGTSSVTVSATVTDAEGRDLPGQAISFSTTDPVELVGPVTYVGDGIYEVTIVSSTTVEAVTITATDSSATPALASSIRLLQVTPAPTVVTPVVSSNPTITGTAEVGATLTAVSGMWTNSPSLFAYQWQNCDASGNNCVDIAGATGQSYQPVSGDAGRTIRVVETATNASGSSQATSNAVGPIVPALPTAAQIASLLIHAEKIPQSRSVKASIRHSGKYSAKVAVPGPGRLTVAWRYKKSAKGSGALLASTTASVKKSGKSTATLKLKLNALGKRLARQGHRVRIAVTVSFTPTGGRTTKRTRTLRVVL